MQCPECGYVMSPFDKDCARCRTLGRRTPRAAAPVAVAAPPAPQQMDLSLGQNNPTRLPAAYQPPPPAQGLCSAPAPQSVYTPPPGVYSSPSLHQTPYTPSPTAVNGSHPHHYNNSAVAGVAGISIIGVICILGRAARIYLAIDRFNHSRDQAETRSVNISVPPFPAPQPNRMTMMPQGYPDTTANRGIASSSFAGSPQFVPTPAQLAAQQAQSQMNQDMQRAQQMQAENMQRVQQMQAENMQRVQQMQAENMQRMQQIQSQMRQNSFPRPGFGMRPTWPGR